MIWLILKIVGISLGYLAIGSIASIFANDSGELSNTKMVIIAIFWLPILIICPIEGLLGTHIIDRWIFNNYDND